MRAQHGIGQHRAPGHFDQGNLCQTDFVHSQHEGQSSVIVLVFLMRGETPSTTVMVGVSAPL